MFFFDNSISCTRKIYLEYFILVITIISILTTRFSSANQSSDYDRSHIECEMTLQDILKFKTLIIKTIKDGKMNLLHLELEKIKQSITLARLQMDEALLKGAWRLPAIKRKGQLLTDRLESVRILNYISLAFTSKYYKYPDGNIPDSVKDSIKKFFQHLNTLSNKVKTTNSEIDSVT